MSVYFSYAFEASRCSPDAKYLSDGFNNLSIYTYIYIFFVAMQPIFLKQTKMPINLISLGLNSAE